MKNMLVSLSVVTALAAPTFAFADEARGRVKQSNSWSITLQDGRFYTFDDGAKIKDIKPGDEVSVTYQPTPDGDIGMGVKRK